MADNSIDLVVSQEAFNQLSRLLVEIKKADDAIRDLKINASGNPTTPSGGEANAAENARLVAQMKSLTSEIDKQTAQIKKLEAAKKSYSKAVTQETVDVTLRNQKAREAFKAVSDEIDAYQKLDAQYKQAVKSAQSIGAQYGENSKVFLSAANSAKELGTKLQTIDASVGKYGRNVGNYASGWNGLSNSVNQLTREAPAFANSLNTGFMALSNNIPILADEINNLKIKNQELAASGKPTESVLSTLTSSLFSWQTVLSVGVTLLTIYGEKLVDWATGADKAKKVIDELNKSQEKSNNLFRLGDDAIDHQIFIQKEKLKQAGANQEKIDALDVKAAEKKLALRVTERDRLKKDLELATKYREWETNNFENNEQAKLAIWAKKRKEQAYMSREERNRADKLAEENRAKELSQFGSTEKERARIKALSNDDAYEKLKQNYKLIDGLSQQSGAKQSEIAESNRTKIKEAENEAAKKLREDREKATEEELKLLAELRKKELQAQLVAIDIKLENEAQYLEDRLDLLNQDFLKRSEIARSDYDEALRLAKGNQRKEKIALLDYQNEQIKIMQDFEDRKKKLKSTGFTEVGDAADSVEQFIKDRKEREAGLNKITEDANIAHTNWKFKKYEEDWQKEQELLKEKAAYMKSFVDEFASNLNLSETFKLFEGKDSVFGRMADGMAFTKDSWKADTVAMMEGVQEMFNFISSASQQNFDAEYARLESQKEIALQFAGESDSAKKKVEEDAEKRRKEIANRENQAKKKQAIFNVAMDTAQAIISIWAQVPKVDFGVSATALSIMVGALGAAQIGMIAAQKIPQYFDGTDNHPGGLALINDGKGSNYKETVVTPDGKVRQFSGRDVMIDAPAGTQVFTHDQWNNELNTMMREKGVSMSNSFNSRSGLSYQEMDSIIAKHFSKITTQSTVIDRNGFNTFVSNGSSKTIRNQSRYSGTGFSV